jgi:predicted nuclease of predicted toxin-antitoxin system
MRIIADENIEATIVAWLREQGEDVISACEIMHRAEDAAIFARANAEKRIILTKDMDFGEMVFHERLVTAGIVLLRFKSERSVARLDIVRRHWPEIVKHAAGNFVVVSQDRLRVRRLTAIRP